MKIYTVTHYYDNGESYEDFRDYEDVYYYSSLELASTAFWEYTCDDFEGKYFLREITLDTQERKLLDESAWFRCSSQMDTWYLEDLEEECNNSEEDEYWEECEEYRYEEELVNSWLTHKNETWYILNNKV